MTLRTVRPGFLGAAAALFALVLYLPTVGHGFVYDDTYLVVANPWITSLSALKNAFSHPLFGYLPPTAGGDAYYRPLAHVLLFLGRRLFGPGPAGFHLLLAVLHAIATAGVFAFCRQLIDRIFSRDEPLLCFLSAALFAAHPIHVEAVAWMSGLMDVGATACAVWALALLLRRDPSRTRAWAGGLLVLCGLLFKETALTVPAVLALVLLSDRRRAPVREVVSVSLPLVLALAVYTGLRLRAVGTATVTHWYPGVTLSGALMSAAALYGQYVRLALWPTGQNVLREFVIPSSAAAPVVVLGLVCALLSAAAGAVALKKRSGLAVLLACWAVALAPALYLPGLGNSAPADRYLYWPSVFVCLGCVLGAALLVERYRSAAARSVPLVAGVVLIAGTAFTEVRLGDWTDELSLWTASVEQNPGSPIAFGNLAMAQEDIGDNDGALASLRRAVSLRPEAPSTAGNLGLLLIQTGRPREAVEPLERAALANPGDARLQLLYGLALAGAGEPQRAVPPLIAASRLDTQSARPVLELVAPLTALGRFEEAKAALEEARRRGADVEDVNKAAHALEEARAQAGK